MGTIHCKREFESMSKEDKKETQGALTMDLWQRGELLAMAAELMPRATAEGGAAGKRLGEFERHYTELAFRVASGIGELHHDWADTFFILQGGAEIVTGGALVGPHTVAPGEERGTAITGAARRRVAAGDVVHIPAGLPHQMILGQGETICYFVLKIQQK